MSGKQDNSFMTRSFETVSLKIEIRVKRLSPNFEIYPKTYLSVLI